MPPAAVSRRQETVFGPRGKGVVTVQTGSEIGDLLGVDEAGRVLATLEIAPGKNRPVTTLLPRMRQVVWQR